MGQSYKCSICDAELDSPADIGKVDQFCEECREKRKDEIDLYKKDKGDKRVSSLRDIKEKQRESW